MNKYDNILAANGDATIIPNYMLSNNQFLLKGPFEQKSDVIVMTIEEAKELWQRSADSQVDKETDYANEINFRAYLQSKGIQL